MILANNMCQVKHVGNVPFNCVGETRYVFFVLEALGFLSTQCNIFG